MKLPSDLAGVTVAKFSAERVDGNPVSAVGPACNAIRQTIQVLGLSEGRTRGFVLRLAYGPPLWRAREPASEGVAQSCCSSAEVT